jgi:hypothetical protein
MRAGRWGSLFAAGVAIVWSAAAMPAPADTNPLGFFYNTTWRHIDEYMHPTAMLVTGRCNRYDTHFAQARAAGAEVLAYLSFVEMPDVAPCTLDTGFYTVNGGRPALWPFPTPGARIDYKNNHMLDIRAGGAWSDAVVAYIEQLMREDKVDGVFLDVHGARLWSHSADWNNEYPKHDGSDADNALPPSPDWTQAERDQWTQGNVDLVRRLDQSRRAINPRFIIVNNNTWAGADPLGATGEQYVDGICLEHHDITASMVAEAGLPFGNGKHRRVLIIANTDEAVPQWTQVDGVTHISNQRPLTVAEQSETPNESEYGSPRNSTVIALHPRTDRQKLFGQVVASDMPSAGMTADRKRASRFTLGERGRLRELSANLDGNGGASGQQKIKLVLYRDNNGVPGSKVAESNERTFSAGAAKNWYSFSLTTANQVLMTPGNYWIALFTGGTEQVVRNYGEAPANWYGNDDLYSDGATDPFGTGNTGTVTLSVRAGYTLE